MVFLSRYALRARGWQRSVRRARCKSLRWLHVSRVCSVRNGGCGLGKQVMAAARDAAITHSAPVLIEAMTYREGVQSDRHVIVLVTCAACILAVSALRWFGCRFASLPGGCCLCYEVDVFCV